MMRERPGNLGGRVGSCPPNNNIGWAANVFCPPPKISQHIFSRPKYTPVIPALVTRGHCVHCAVGYQPSPVFPD